MNTSASAANESHLKSASKILEFMRPKPCPVPLVRIGGEKDGAYLLPDDLDGIAACFSPGVNNFKTFEDSLLSEYSILSHMCDFTSDVESFRTPLIEGKQSFLKKWLDINGSTDSISLTEWIDRFCPGNQDLLLQIDIEGAEYRNISGTDISVLQRFRVIVIELHSLHRLNNAGFTSEVLKPFFDKLENDFVCVHAHPNNCSAQASVLGTDFRVPPVMELTLLRRDRVPSADTNLIAPLIPHPLDIARNVQNREPQWLDENWLDGPRPEVSRLKILQDELDFLRNRPKWDPEMRRQTVKQLNWMLESCAAALQVVKSGPPSDTPVDCAQGKPFKLSSARGGRALGGNVVQRSPYFFHTADEIGPTITIDLEDFFALTEIIIKNRTNGWFSRCECLVAFTHSTPDPKSGLGFPFVLSDEFLTGAEQHARLALPDVVARYVSIATPLDTALHLSDIKVMGYL